MTNLAVSRRKVLAGSAACTVAATAPFGSVFSEPLPKDTRASEKDFSSVQRNP
ncbi:uncharacterized protein METZ01_LOCUS402849, partial [marine metagenome]